jgi:glucose-1-phosphate thymidylyltransferase
MLGIVPAAGSASRLQPLGGSKELLPLGWEEAVPPAPGRLRAISEYLIERMLAAGADRVCLIVSSDKSDLLRFYGRASYSDRLFFLVQPQPAGLCDAVFRAAPFVQEDEPVLIGLPDTVWFPASAYTGGMRDTIHLITFPVDRPEDYDAVIPAGPARVARVEVKMPGPRDRRVWGAVTAPAAAFRELARFWRAGGGREQYLGHLLNAWIDAGNLVSYDAEGTHYWDIGTPAGYRAALQARVWEPHTGRPSLTAA